ncbi:MAG TPA: helix-turn-helix domain-containing protein [Dongiaceae bacterium]|nr:helix-turn-helix domain-containing protein [Dongiaceae bacterium]
MKRPRAPLRSPGDRTVDSVLPADLVRALAWLRRRLDQPVRVDALAEVAGVRPRTLENHFRTFLGTTPLGWVRRTRLHKARRALLEGDDRSITEAALANGFSQLGRFAAYYRAEFGELPSETLQRVRAAEPDLDDEALRLTWRALPAALHVAPGGCEAALENLERAQTRAPTFGLAKALAAWCWGQRAA